MNGPLGYCDRGSECTDRVCILVKEQVGNMSCVENEMGSCLLEAAGIKKYTCSETFDECFLETASEEEIDEIWGLTRKSV